MFFYKELLLSVPHSGVYIGVAYQNTVNRRFLGYYDRKGSLFAPGTENRYILLDGIYSPELLVVSLVLFFFHPEMDF